MSHRLRHRLTFDPRALTNSLNLRNPRTSAPAEWSWTWPLHNPPNPPSTPLRNPWVSAIRTVTVSDDASSIAFLTHDDGHIALLHPSSPTPIPIPRPKGLGFPSSIALFHFSNPILLLAVGFHSGHIAIYEPTSTTPLFVSRPSQTLPIRRLRYYPAFRTDPATAPYPTPSANTGLFAVLGWSGTLARLPGHEMQHFIEHPPDFDDRGAGWVVWNTTEQQAVLEAALVGPDPSSICELDLGTSAPHRVLLAGANPALAAYAITSDRAFSAREVAKRAASSVFSAAKGLLWSRMSVVDSAVGEEVRKAVTGVARVSTAWADDGVSGGNLISFGDVRDSARKSVNAVLSRGRRRIDIDGVAVEKMKILSTVEDEKNFDTLTDGMLSRQRSRFAGDEVTHVTNIPQNTRVVEHVAAAPLPCSLVATADTLGRVFVQDSRDLCVLRVLKGYRDARVAWLKEGGPLLVVLTPRLNVLEVHRPLAVKREAAFRLLPGSMLVQSAAHHVFCITPDGKLYELMKARKGHDMGNIGQIAKSGTGDAMDVVHGIAAEACDGASTRNEIAGDSDAMNNVAADYEEVGMFVEAVKRGQTSAAAECLQRAGKDAVKVAHLMATLVTCAAYIRTEMHVALSSKAAQLVSNLGNDDLVSRFEAHGRLAEAFALLATENFPAGQVVEQDQISKYGHRILEDDLGSGLAPFAVEERKKAPSSSKVGGKRIRTTTEDETVVNCERFILSHALQPSADLRAKVDFVLCPRGDLSITEQIWLAKVYFSRLLEVDSADIPTEGREHPTTKDVFLALTDFVGLLEEEITSQFVTFFLNSSLLPILHTHMSMYASPLRCTIGRLRNQFAREVVDQIVVDMCETSSHVPNAVLLIRLFAFHDRRRSSSQSETQFLQSLKKLDEVLLYRKLIMGTSIPPHVYEKFTARECTGVPGDAERHAMTCLIVWNEFERASQILMTLEESRKQKGLDWHESTSISEAALHGCRKKAVSLVTDAARKVIPENVVSWILIAGAGENQLQWEHLLSTKREAVLRQIRRLLVSAHQYFPDSSVDAVRCLQLAEAMSALIELEQGAPVPSLPKADNFDEAKVVGGIDGAELKEATADLEMSTIKNASLGEMEDEGATSRVEVSEKPVEMLTVPTMSDGAEAPSLGLDDMDIDFEPTIGQSISSLNVDDQEFYDAPSILPVERAKSSGEKDAAII